MLAHAFEYRFPTAEQSRQAVLDNPNDPDPVVDMVSRYLGLVVVPGQHIVKIHLEQYASQMK